MRSKARRTDQSRCSNPIPSSFMLMATRRTNGESNRPMSITVGSPVAPLGAPVLPGNSTPPAGVAALTRLDGRCVMDPIVSTEWLAAELAGADLVVPDATWYAPGDKRDARGPFATERIPRVTHVAIELIA